MEQVEPRSGSSPRAGLSPIKRGQLEATAGKQKLLRPIFGLSDFNLEPALRLTGEMLLGPPKSRAGRRIVGIPETIVPALHEHLAVLVEDDPGALVFSGAKGGPLRRVTSTRCPPGPRRSSRSACRACTSAISATPGTSSRRRAAPGSGT
jgi:hypothetical protein